MEKLFEIQDIIITGLSKSFYYPRLLFNKINLDNHITGIIGQRGIGKTTFLLQQAIAHGASSRRALYVSADNLYFLENTIVDLVDTLYKETPIRLLCIDEVHKYSNWKQELKNIADIYQDFKILFSGSSMIDLVKSKHDLSRRSTIHYLPGLSFREFLQFYHQIDLPLVNLQDLLENLNQMNELLSLQDSLILFKEYLMKGYYPFFHKFSEDSDKYQAIVTSSQTTIFEDIALHHNLKTPSLLTIENLFKYVLQSNPGELNINKLANAVNKDHESVKNYLYYLEQAGLLQFLYSKKTGKAQLRKLAKIYPENTNLLYAYYLPSINDNMIGKIRETFVINQLHNAKYDTRYPENGDLSVGGYTFEVGGKKKSTAQIQYIENAFVIADGILTATPSRVPIYYFGFLY